MLSPRAQQQVGHVTCEGVRARVPQHTRVATYIKSHQNRVSLTESRPRACEQACPHLFLLLTSRMQPSPSLSLPGALVIHSPERSKLLRRNMKRLSPCSSTSCRSTSSGDITAAHPAASPAAEPAMMLLTAFPLCFFFVALRAVLQRKNMNQIKHQPRQP